MKIIKCIQQKDGVLMDSSNYSNYLETVKYSVSKRIYQFMSADWHYDYNNEKCPHDAKIENIIIKEYEKDDFINTDIEIFLLGAYGNKMKYSYYNVHSYIFEKKKTVFPSNKENTHGDFMIDEMLLFDHEIYTHEIILYDASIFIKFENFDYLID